jgi:hypothetical protein
MMRWGVLGIVALVLLASDAAAQTPVPTPQLATGSPHIVAYVSRIFQTPTVRLVGPTYIEAQAALADDPNRASNGLHSGVDGIRQLIEAEGGIAREASAPQIGEERVAIAGGLPSGSGVQLGLIIWREGNLVITLIATGYGEQLPSLFAIVRAIEGREPGPESLASPVPDELSRGGIWDVLPTLDDVPEGFVFIKDEIW